MSSEWIKCTAPNGVAIFVNMANVAYIRVVESETRIVFPGASDDYLRVAESPEDILALRIAAPA